MMKAPIIGGLTAAIALRHAGWGAEVLGHAAKLAEIGSGLLLRRTPWPPSTGSAAWNRSLTRPA
jgi:hypothetical protein